MLLLSILLGVVAFAVGTEADAATLGASTTGSGSVSATATTTSSTAAATHSIAVGASGFVLEPHEVTNASVGDIIEFRFYPTGHWIVRSEFKQSCIPYEDTGPNKVGFSSGAIDVQTTSDNDPTFQVRVNDTDPIFFYCAAPGSCVDHQMVGVINPNATFTYEIQLEYAENATYQMTPGEAFPSETASSTSATSTSGAPSSTGSSSGGHLGAGAIAGIAIGAAAVALLAAALLYMCGRRGGMDRASRKHTQNTVYDGPPMHEATYTSGPIGPGPRSPGQETFTTAFSAAAPSTVPSHMQMPAGQYGGAVHRMVPSGYPASSGSPPPLSEYSQSLYNVHGQQHGAVQGMGSPLMGGVEGGYAMQNGFFITPQVPTQHQRHQSTADYAIELPTSRNPGNSPLPGYSQEQKTYSWAQDGEGTYRPSKS